MALASRRKFIVEAPIPNHDPINNLQGTKIFDQAKNNNAMNHVLVLSAKVRRMSGYNKLQILAIY